MKVFISILIVVSLCSCHSGGIEIPPQPAFSHALRPIHLTPGDTTKINLSDYFSDLSDLTKISGSKNLEILHETDSSDLYLIPRAEISPLSNLTFRYKDFNYDIPLLTNHQQAGTQFMIYTDKIEGDTLFLRSNRSVEKWIVYIDNYRLRKKLLISDTNQIGIILPPQIAQLKYSVLRVWASDGKNVSNDVYVPLKGKQAIRAIHWPDSLREQNFLPLNVQDIDTTINRTAGRVFVRHSEKFTRLHQLLSEMQGKYGVHNDKRYILTESKNKIPGFQVADSSTYSKLLQLWTFHATIPGNPELCPADSLLIPANPHDDILTLKDNITQLNNLAGNNMALIFGDFIPLRVEDRIYAYMRSYFGQEVIVIFNKNTEAITLKLDLPEVKRNEDFKALFDNRFSYDNSRLLLDVPALGVEVIYN